MTQPLVFPVGLLVGTYHDDGDANGRHHEVLVGKQVQNLDDAEFAAWLFAHGQPEGVPAETAWTTPALLRLLASQQVPKPAPVVDGLLERRLIAEVVPTGDGRTAFARAHRVVPIMQGLGNSPDDPWMFSIGLPGAERIQVSRIVFDVWAWSHLDDNLWRACEVIAEFERAQPDAEPTVTEPGRILAGFLSTLHGLLNAQAAYIDTVDTADAADSGAGSATGAGNGANP